MLVDRVPPFIDPARVRRVVNGIIYSDREQSDGERNFLREYRAIRRHEGRGGLDPEEYQKLPWAGFQPERKREWEERGRSLTWLLDRYVDRLSAMRVLDAGAGNCWLSNRLLEMGAEVVALDIDDSEYDGLAAGGNIVAATNRFETGGGPVNERFFRVAAPYRETPFRSNSFDLIVFNGAIHYADDPGAVIAEGKRLIRRGGEIVIMDSPIYRREESGERMVRERGGPTRAGYLTFGQLREIARRLDLEIEMIPRTSGPFSLIRRMFHRIRLRREPARMPWIVFYL